MNGNEERSGSLESNSSLSCSAGSWIATALALLISPSLMFLVTRGDLSAYWEFPPKTLYIKHSPFAWSWWFFYALVGLGLFVLVFRAVSLNFRGQRRTGILSCLTLLMLCLAWCVAWNRFEWAATIQRHTFLLVWGSYILFMNVLLYEIAGQCPFISNPSRYLASFVASGLFWWAFEFLNRFTQNWVYSGVESFSPLSYAVFASLSFSTVLPSVWVTKEFIQRCVLSVKEIKLSLTIEFGRADLMKIMGIGTLIFLPFAPDYLFPSLWVAPILLVIAFDSASMPRTIKISETILWAIAGVWCGILWEMWNIDSLARWSYHIPFVERFYLFEMPIVGYAGYIPFGVLCGMAIESLKASIHDGVKNALNK